jgi:hypothetical protein
MAAFTFLQLLQSEVARMQSLHPAREGEIARAHALILNGQVLPSADDPSTGTVLSSDGQTVYHVNGTCDCSAGQHGRDCKHLHSWKLYQHISKKVAAQGPPVHDDHCKRETPLPEARASLNFKALIGGFETQITLRSDNEEDLLQRLHALVQRSDLRPIPRSGGNWKRTNPGR